MNEIKLSDLSERNLIQFYIQATSFREAKTFIVDDSQCIIESVDEFETEMFIRSQQYWHTQIQQLKDFLKI